MQPPIEEFALRVPSHSANSNNEVLFAEVIDIIPTVSLGKSSTLVCCPICDITVYTRVVSSPSSLAWSCSGLFACIFWPLMCLPFCILTPDIDHYCSHCNNLIG